MRFLHLLAFGLLFIGGPQVAIAQVASLLADQIRIEANDSLVASGHVEILTNTARLTASRLIYNSVTGTLKIEGPITLIQGDETLFLASAAELDRDLKNGILKSARMVLDRQLQIAAVEINRVDGRYTQLYKSVASSCRVCKGAKAPLWEIRSTKIIHDQKERQLYFENAQFRVGGVPIFTLPRLRMPDPTNERAKGFLEPLFRDYGQLGPGLKLPYFIPLGDHADITLTPFVSSKSTALEMRYRQAFKTGRIQLDGAIARDQLQPGVTRAYLFGSGNFTLPKDFKLTFGFEQVSDPAFLSAYGYSGKSQLDDEINITRTRQNDYFNGNLIHYTTLHGAELAIDDQLPNLQGELLYEKRFFPRGLGGQGLWSLGLEGYQRASSVDQLGRDVAHFNGRLNWGNSTVFSNGMVGRVGAELTADAYLIAQDTSFSPTQAFLTPAGEIELRWPLVKTGQDGAGMVFEPVIHLAWAGSFGADVPNEDSTFVEFDDGNLFSISRFPGEDRYETGARATVGMKWTRYDPKGWSLGLGLGRVYRDADQGQFNNASGLNGVNSDWLLSGQVKLDSKLSIDARALFGDDLGVTKAETRASWKAENIRLDATYSWVVPELSENRPDLVSHATLDGKFTLGRHWLADASVLYDINADKITKASYGLEYINECISVDLSLSRRFNSSTSVTPTTDIGVSVALLGFGSGKRGPKRACNGL